MSENQSEVSAVPAATAPPVATAQPAVAMQPLSSDQVNLLLERARRLTGIAEARRVEVDKLYEEFGPNPQDPRVQQIIGQKTLSYVIDAQEATAAIFLSNLAQERVQK